MQLPEAGATIARLHGLPDGTHPGSLSVASEGSHRSRRSTTSPWPRTRYGSAVEEPETTAAPRDRALVSFLVFSASRRHESLNATLARLAADTIAKHGASVDHASMSDFDVPAYDGDLERDEGLPPGAEELRRRLLASDAFVIASPEYNASMPGLLKNADRLGLAFAPSAVPSSATACCSRPRRRW